MNARLALACRFRDFTNDYPWNWGPGDVEGFTSSLISERSLAPSTIRGYQISLRMFCDYLSDQRYDWQAECLRRFGTAPVQICHEWNTVAHLADYEGRTERRPFTFDELQAFFDHADSRVQSIVDKGRKGALA